MNTRILFIGSTRATATKELQTEAHARNIIFDTICSKNIDIIDNTIVSTQQDALLFPIMEYDVYLFRGIPSSRKLYICRVAKILSSHGKKVVEPCLAINGYPDDKVVPKSSEQTYAIPISQTIEQPTGNAYEYSKFSFPFVAKVLDSRLGRGVSLIENHTQYTTFLDTFIHEPILLQEYLKFPYDIRVLVIDGNTVGGYARYKPEGELLLTTKKGGKREPIELSKSCMNAAIEAAHTQQIKIAGVDLCIYNDTIYILEVNMSPQFHVFKKVTGVDVAAKIIDYLQT